MVNQSVVTFFIVNCCDIVYLSTFVCIRHTTLPTHCILGIYSPQKGLKNILWFSRHCSGYDGDGSVNKRRKIMVRR